MLSCPSIKVYRKHENSKVWPALLVVVVELLPMQPAVRDGLLSCAIFSFPWRPSVHVSQKSNRNRDISMLTGVFVIGPLLLYLENIAYLSHKSDKMMLGWSGVRISRTRRKDLSIVNSSSHITLNGRNITMVVTTLSGSIPQTYTLSARLCGLIHLYRILFFVGSL